MLPSAVSLSIQVLRASEAKPEPEGRGVAAAIRAGCDIDSSLSHGHSASGSPYVQHLMMLPIPYCTRVRLAQGPPYVPTTTMKCYDVPHRIYCILRFLYDFINEVYCMFSSSRYTWSLADALKQKLVDSDDVDTLLHRSIRLRFELGLFDPIEDQPYWHYSVADKVRQA